jgi:hypothetical protein
MAYNGPKITDEEFAEAVAGSNSMSETLRKLNRYPGGSSHKHYTKRAKELGLNMDHFNLYQFPKGKERKEYKTSSKILINDQYAKRRTRTYQLRRAMLEENVAYSCSACSLTSWNDKEIVLQIDHINGDWKNNLIDNLRFLCPNCHSQTDTYGIKNNH